MKRHVRWWWGAAGLLGMILVPMATPAKADWLVTSDGARVETKGPWKVKGNQVIFTLPNGTLSAMRKSEVDLDASASATAGTEADASETAESRKDAAQRKSVAVFDNTNIGRAAPEAPDAEAQEQGKAEDKKEPSKNAQVEIVSWSERDREGVDGLEIVGTVRNNGPRIAANINVKVIVLDEAGETKLETTAFLRSAGLVPGKSTTFRALLPGIFTLFTEPKFEVTAGGIELDLATAEEIEGAEQEP